MMDIQFQDHTAMTGHFRVEVRRNGVLVDVISEQNLIVNGAKNQLAHMVGGDGTNRHITGIGFGTGKTAASPGDSALANPYIKPVGSVQYPASGRVQFNWSLSTAELNGVGITEFGLLCADGTLFSRKQRAVIQKEADMSLTGSWTILFYGDRRMANLNENPVWENQVYQIETNDPVLGGPDGISNIQAKQLANRTRYLKARADLVDQAKGTHGSLVERMNSVEQATEALGPEAQDDVNAALGHAINLAALAAKGVRALHQFAQQEGVLTIANRGVVSGCAITRSTTAARNLHISAGKCFARGR